MKTHLLWVVCVVGSLFCKPSNGDMETKTVIVGKNVSLHCKATLNYSSFDWWYRKDLNSTVCSVVSEGNFSKEYKNSSFSMLKQHPGDYSLFIWKAELKDSGTYTCNENGPSKGLRQTEIRLQVVGATTAQTKTADSAKECVNPTSTICKSTDTYAIVVTILVIIIIKTVFPVGVYAWNRLTAPRMDNN